MDEAAQSVECALARTRGSTGRWWSLRGAVDLVPTRDHVAVAVPAFLIPFIDASEIAVTGRDQGRIRLAGGLASHGEGARLVRDRNGRVREVWLGGSKLLTEGRAKAELQRKYGGSVCGTFRRISRQGRGSLVAKHFETANQR